MPKKSTKKKAQSDKRKGKAASTQAGNYVHEEMEHIREGNHGAKSSKQAIAIGLSKARQEGIKVPGKGKKKTKKTSKKKSPARSRAQKKAGPKRLKKEPRSAASHRALSRQSRSASKKRGKRARSESAKKAVRTRQRHG